ncbi:MAG TPA: hypothetical protein VLB83_05695 [Candidatus Paceibacterota bacterium]|nr:hypothetical protein [Candidatus Paceibacterota bacterium]
MEFLNYPPMQLAAIGIMTATLMSIAIRLYIVAGSRGAFHDFLALVIIVGGATLGFGIGVHSWLLIVGSWSTVVLTWIIDENIGLRHKHQPQAGSSAPIDH